MFSVIPATKQQRSSRRLKGDPAYRAPRLRRGFGLPFLQKLYTFRSLRRRSAQGLAKCHTGTSCFYFASLKETKSLQVFASHLIRGGETQNPPLGGFCDEVSRLQRLDPRICEDDTEGETILQHLSMLSLRGTSELSLRLPAPSLRCGDCVPDGLRAA